jgi:hypothetical protein
MQRRWTTWLAGAVAATGLAAGVTGWLSRPAPKAMGMPAAPMAPAKRSPTHTAHPVAAQAAHPMAPAVPPTTQPAFASDATLSMQVGRLRATHDPADALRAYRLIDDCARFNHAQGGRPASADGMDERAWARGMRVCGGMTERDRLTGFDDLAFAARAGVPGAAVAFEDAGPFGDPSALQTRPDDPLVQAWKATARAQMTQAAEAGTDLMTLNVWAAENYDGSDLTDRNPALAYRYTTALDLVFASLYGADQARVKAFAAVTAQLAADLTPAQQAVEMAAARRIADRARREARRQ